MRCWPGCFTGGAAVEVGGGVVAHGQRLQAAVLLFKRRRERDLFLFPSPLVFLFFFLSLFRLPVVIPLSSRFCFKKTSLPGFKLPLTLSFLSLFHFSLWLVLSSPPLFFLFRSLSFLFPSFSSLRSLFSLFVLCYFSASSLLLFFFSPVCWRWGVFIRQKGAGASLLPPYSSAWGVGLCCPATEPNEVASRCGWQGASLGVSSMKGHGAMGCDRSVQREREA